MSSRQLEEQYDNDREKAIAKELGITPAELGETDYEIDTDESNDGLVYGYLIKFSQSSPKRILNKIEGLENNQIKIDLSDFNADIE